MNNKELQLVNHDQAILLKKVGFDWECCMRYEDDRLLKSFFSNHNILDDVASAPTVALALKWIRNKGITIALDGKYWCKYQKCFNHFEEMLRFDTYESAESALLDELLNILNSFI